MEEPEEDPQEPQDLDPAGQDVTFEFNVQVLTQALRELRCEFDPALQPLSVSVRGLDTFSVQNEGTIYLLQPLTRAAQEWIDENLFPDRLTFGDAVVIEHRYVCDILDGIRLAGLEVQ